MYKLTPVIAVDFDGTLCKNDYPNIGEPNIFLIEKLKDVKKNLGAKIILWTCREGELLGEAVLWCEYYGLKFDAINDNIAEMKELWCNNPRKIGADFYIDDKNLSMRDAEEHLSSLLQLKIDKYKESNNV